MHLCSGRYRVTLPRRSGMLPLGDSRKQALQQYQANERSLLKKGTWKSFQSVVQEYLDLDHAEPVPLNHLTTQPAETYLHRVSKSSSTSTELRVVFDLSAKTSSHSLNDTVLIGPTLFPNLDCILMKFRTSPRQTFRAVEVNELDRDLHRIL